MLLCELLHDVCLSALADAFYHKRLPILCLLPFGQICFYLPFKHSFPRLAQCKNTFFQANTQDLLHFSERISSRSTHFSERINKFPPQITEIRRKTLPLLSQAFCNIYAGMFYRSELWNWQLAFHKWAEERRYKAYMQSGEGQRLAFVPIFCELVRSEVVPIKINGHW